MLRSNRVITAHALLHHIENKKKDPYRLVSPLAPYTVSSNSRSPDVLEINNLVFMDDSTLLSSSKEGMEHMLSITEEFYCLNNTSANHNKYVLATNAVAASRDLSPIAFNLSISSLNSTPNIIVTPIPMSSSFQFLGVWFNINGSRNFIRQQLKREYNSFSAILRPAKLTVQQVVYLYNTVLILKLDYRMQVTHLSEAECSTITSSVRALVKHKAKLSRSVPNVVLYLTHSLGLINLFSFQQQSHFTNLFLLANSSSVFMKSLFNYRLRFIQFYCLIPISPLMVLDWTCWSSLIIFKQDYIANTLASLLSTPFRLLRKRGLFYLSQLLTPQGTHLLSWSVIYANSVQKRGNARLSMWYKNLSTNITIPDKPGLLKDRFLTEQQPVSLIAKELAPCIPPSGYKKNWIVTLNDNGLPLFNKQIQIQPKHSTCTIVHWTSDCLSRPSDLITLRPCPGCNLNINKSSYSKKSVATGFVSCSYSASLRQSWILPMKKSSILNHTSSLTATVSWAEIMDFVTASCNPLGCSMLAADIPHTSFDIIDEALPTPHLLTAGDVAVSSSVMLSRDSQYTFYTDGSLINLGTCDVSMGWGWVQIVKDSGFLNSIATYKQGIIRNWPSSSRAEAAAIYAALSASPANSVVHIYTDSQSSIEGLKHCFLSDYSNSRLYYKTTNFELWAIIQQLIVDKQLSVLPFKVKAHSNFYWNDFADSLANTAHTSDDAILISHLDLAAVDDYIMTYDDVVCESNPRHLSILIRG
ncbi:ribonuclease H-like domain-containing protein [Rhizophagus irregularis DAOM 181602=DAOM 197198]|nr:ribonuclease H-like domain-containing protein [Rhizophagus irregularis DAOM 181602=DAOM 197198]